MRRDRWPSEPEERAPAEERSNLTASIEHSMRKLLSAWRAPDDWAGPEFLALKLMRRITLALLMGPPGPALEVALNRALAVFEKEPDEKRRYWAVTAIARCGAQWQRLNAKDRHHALLKLVRELEVIDWAFNNLVTTGASGEVASRTLVDPSALIAKFDAYSPSAARTPGAKSAERILAELIVEDVDALGLGPHEGENLDGATDRIRDRLIKDVDAFLASVAKR